ncbi:TraR/DksA C4-type zinc finger protein [Nitrosovibrio sp. Nv6]|uniref:TraR/DksA family transcriptional regulator n=1 Tax=Nitrosovibrio sp. Nv6 TaxID=1855340 RepID=UPI0008BDB73A|nr:TraR/DksA C4-type zinc finger protein [Nitrosovibrio sp. Nv6]SEP42952.1 DnaK suppressor protein [Nitrosovibrio sp. Nv6]
MLTNTEIERFGFDLEERLQSVIKAIDAGSEDQQSIALDQSKVGRLSRMDALQQHAMSLGFVETLMREKRRLEAALARMERSDFGICCKCGDYVQRERLEVDPAVPFCGECQHALEEKRQDRR